MDDLHSYKDELKEYYVANGEHNVKVITVSKSTEN